MARPCALVQQNLVSVQSSIGIKHGTIQIIPCSTSDRYSGMIAVLFTADSTQH